VPERGDELTQHLARIIVVFDDQHAARRLLERDWWDRHTLRVIASQPSGER
jgi:hypothetical protein